MVTVNLFFRGPVFAENKHCRGRTIDLAIDRRMSSLSDGSWVIRYATISTVIWFHTNRRCLPLIFQEEMKSTKKLDVLETGVRGCEDNINITEYEPGSAEEQFIQEYLVKGEEIFFNTAKSMTPVTDKVTTHTYIPDHVWQVPSAILCSNSNDENA